VTPGGPDVKAIFTKALEIPIGPGRDAYLAAACGGDDALRHRVEELLAALEQASDVLGPAGPMTIATAPDAPTAADEPTGSRRADPETIEANTHATDDIRTVGPEAVPGETATTAAADRDALPHGAAVRYFGDYEIQRELGRGGMGVVYEARQVSLNRAVALKMVKAGLLAGGDELRRFQNEAEAVALLDHPGVVPIHEVGEHEGQPYFSMKLVPGGSLVPILDRYRDDPRAAATLVAEAAEAVAHAHARGILHRDLKPANILVDDQGHPHVTDFGLAKRVEADIGLTQSGAILGTPAYMSPEQASGRRGAVTTASDVYGLGAVLYALLTGKAPFGGDSVVETIDAVRNRPPEPPRKRNGAIPRDLETICLKCLEKDPRRRYPTALALADDLRAGLESRPIAARRVGAAERAWLWCRRKPAIAALSAAVALAIIGGTATVIAVQARANAELRAANHRVEQRYELAVDAIKTFHTGVSEDFLLKQDQFKDLRDRLLKSAADFYGKLGALLGQETDLSSRRALAQAGFELAELTEKVGRKEDALAAHRAVLARREAMAAGSRASPETKVDVGRSLTAVAALLESTGQTGEAEATYRKAESLLAEPARSSPSARAALGDCRSRLGSLLSSTGRVEDALAAYRLARADQEALAGPADTTGEARRDLADTIRRIGLLLEDLGHWSEAEAEMRASLAIRRELADAYPAVAEYRSRLAAGHNSLGFVLGAVHRDSEAEAEYRASLATRRGLADAYPAVATFRHDLQTAHVNLGENLRGMNKPSEAEAEIRAGLAIERRLVEEYPTVTDFRVRLSACHMTLSDTLFSLGRLSEAEAEIRASLAIDRRLADENPAVPNHRFSAAITQDRLGSLIEETGNRSEAEAEFRAALAIQQRLADAYPAVTLFRDSLAQSRNNFGFFLMRMGRPAQAEAEIRTALAIRQKVADENPTFADGREGPGYGHLSLGDLLLRAGRMSEAEAEYRTALAIGRALADANPAVHRHRDNLAWRHHVLGDLLMRTGRMSEAEAEYRTALAIGRALADANPDYRSYPAPVHQALGDLLLRTGRASEAEAEYRAALAIRQKAADANPAGIDPQRDLASSLSRMGRIEQREGRIPEAIASFRNAVAIMERLPRIPNSHLYDLACHQALLAGATGSRTEADRAMDSLQRSVALRGGDLAGMRTDPGLDPLRDRDDFRLLMLDLAFPADPFARRD
jgi:tetratricopeptide (TPR) repeat protein